MSASGQAGPDGDRVRAVVEEVLARPEFREEQDPLGGVLEDFFSWLEGLFPDISLPEAGAGAHQFGVTLAALAGLGLVLLLARSLRARRRRAEEASPDAERAARVDELRARAREAEADGDLTLALRLHFFALVIGLGQRGELVYSDAFTNRELLERGAPRPEVERLLGPLVRELDEHSFGHRPTGPAEVARFASLCERLLGEEAA